MKLAGVSVTTAAGRLLTAPTMQAHNTFASPDVVRPVVMSGLTVAGDTLQVRLPAKAVVMVTLR